MQHLLSGCRKLAATEYVRRHDNALNIMVVKRAKKEGLLPEKTRWRHKRWEKGHLIEKDREKILWYCEHMMRTHGKAWRPDLILEDERKKEIFYIVDVACPAKGNKSEKN